jgi:hypothetical protein
MVPAGRRGRRPSSSGDQEKSGLAATGRVVIAAQGLDQGPGDRQPQRQLFGRVAQAEGQLTDHRRPGVQLVDAGDKISDSRQDIG